LEFPLPLHIPTRRDLGLLIFLFLLATFVRLDRIGISDFRYDEGILSGLATNWLQGGAFPTRGLLASVGLPQGPLMVYLIAIPYLLFASPVAATAFVAVLNIGGVMVLWGLARRIFSPMVGWFAAFAYAVSPWAIVASRKIWNPNMHTPLLLAAVLLAWIGVWERKRPWAQVVAVALVLVVPQFHYQGWLLLPVLLVIFWQGRRHIVWPAVLVGATAAVILWLPLVTSITSQDMDMFRSFSSQRGEKSWSLRDQSLGYVIHMVTGWYVVEEMVGVENAAAIPSQAHRREWGVLLVLFGIGAVGAWRRYGQRTVMLYVWAFLTPIIVAPNWVQIFGHYFTLIMPALFLFVGLGVEQIIIWGRHRSVVVAAVSAVSALVFTSQVIWGQGLLTDFDTTYVTYGFGAPLHYLMEGRTALEPYEDVLIIGGNPFLTTDSSIWKPLMYGQAACVRDLVIAGGNVAVLPDHPFAVMVASYAAPYSLRDFYTQTPAQVIALRPGEDPYTIYVWDAAPKWTGEPIVPVNSSAFENGVRLTGYALTPESLYLQWHIDATGSRENVQYFAHFLDAAGEKIGQRDTSFYDVQYWCEGDTIITRVDTPIPAETDVLRVGMYRLIDGNARGLSTIDESGQLASGTIDIDVP